MRLHVLAAFVACSAAVARTSRAGGPPSPCATLDQCVSELRGNPRDQALRDRIIELTLSASTSTAAGVERPAGTAAFLEQFKKIARGRYRGNYQCGRLTPLMAMQRRERMDCDEAELESGHWHRIDALGIFVFRFPKDGSIEFWNRRGFGFGDVLAMVGTPRGAALRNIEWKSCDRRRRCETPVWVLLSDDLRTVTASPDRPVDASRFDPKARYAYTQYRR